MEDLESLLQIKSLSALTTCPDHSGLTLKEKNDTQNFRVSLSVREEDKKKRATLTYRSFLFVTSSGEISNFLMEDLNSLLEVNV